MTELGMSYIVKAHPMNSLGANRRIPTNAELDHAYVLLVAHARSHLDLDALHDAILRVYRNGIRIGDSLIACLLSAMKSVRSNRMRKARREIERDRRMARQLRIEDGSDPSKIAENREARALAHRALKALPAHKQLAFLAVCQRTITVDEVCRRLGKSRRQVRALARDAARRMERFMERA